MHSLEAACNEAQNLINIFDSFGARTESCPSRSTQGSCTSLPGPSWSNGIHNQSLLEPSKKSRVFNIRQRLRELYLEECRNTQPYSSSHLPFKNLKRGSKLLEKLVQRDNLNTLIVNLYPGNKGYSLSLRLQGKVPTGGCKEIPFRFVYIKKCLINKKDAGIDGKFFKALGNQAGRSQGSEPVVETMRWPYSDEELLRCIDNEEIPATLVDLLEANHSELFYQGCVIAEIRDYRLTFPLYSFETHHVLLKPTTQSIINDVNIISSSQDFSAEDRLSLESQIVLATAPPLCLDPNPAVGILINNLQHKKQRLSTAPLRRTARKFSQVTVNRKRKLDQFTSHNTLQLYDFITRKKAKLRSTNQIKQPKKVNEGALPPPPPVPSEEAAILQPPSVKPDVFKYAKHYEKSRETTDCSVHLIEEYILETERGQGRIYRIKLSILQRHSNMEYLGELYVDRDYKEGEKSGASCRFVLGTRVHANRYIQQFTEIFTEEGRKSVRITHVIPGQQHHVSYTPGMRERSAVAQAKKNAQSTPVGGHGKQPGATVNSTQNLSSNHNSNLQHILPNPQQLTVQTQHIEPNSANTINYNVNSQQIQKLHGQLTSGNANLLPQNPGTNSNIQINSVSHLTSLLANSNVSATPNVNIHQIQQTQNVIGITGQSLSGLAQPVQSIVNVQNIGISNQNMNTSTIQSLLSNALNSSVLSDEGVNMMNGSTSSGVTGSHNTACNTTSNATIHHQPSQNQPTTKPSRPPLATNPAISALVTSLMNSAQQFQVQQAAQQAASNSNSANVQSAANNITQSSTSTNSQNPTILSLLNATTPLSVNNNNVITTSHVNLGQQNQKLLTRKTITNLLSSRLINQNLSALLNNSVGNPTLVVNNANSQQLRVTLSSLNQLVNATNQSTVSSNQTPQILNIGNVNQVSGSSNPGTGFTIATQTTNLTTQTFTIANTDSQTFTITSPNPVPSQTYSLNSPTIGSLAQTQNQTFSITSNTGSISPQSFTISSANSTSIANSNALTNAGFTLSPTQSPASQPQTFTVLQPNQNLTNQSFTITTPVGNQGFTVTNAQAAVGNQAFTISNTNLSPVQNKTFQINSPGTTNQTFTITTPVVSVANQFVNCQSPASNQNYSQSSSQTFTLNAQSTQPTNTTSVLTVNSPLPNQVFTVNIQSPSSKPGFSQAYSNSSQLGQGKTLSPQNSVLINKSQTYTGNANKNFTVTTPPLAKNVDNGNNGKSNTTGGSNSSGGNNVSGNSTISNSKSVKEGSNSNNSGSNASNNNSNNSSNNNNNNNHNNNSNNSGSNASGGGSRINAGRIATCQRRLSNALQQASQNSELNKLLLERCDNSRLLMDTHKLVNDKSDSENSRLGQALSEKKLSESNKLCQALSCTADEGPSQSASGAAHSSTSNLGLSMPGLSALLAGTPSADNPIPGASNSSSLLERLTSSAPNATAFNSPPLPATPQSPSVSALSPNQNLSFQNSSFSTSPVNNNNNNNNNNNSNNNSSSSSSSGSSNSNNNNNNSNSSSSSNNNNSNTSSSSNNNNNNSNSSSTSNNNNNINNNNTFNSVNTNSPSSNITSPVPNFSSSSPKNQAQFQSPSPNSKEVLGITSPLSSPPGTAPVSLNLQGLSLQGITGLQNVQVSIPGLPVPILSLNVAGQSSGTQGVLMTSLPVAPTTNTMTTTSASPLVVANSASAGNGGNVLSLPVAHLMTSGVKNPNQRTSTASSISFTQGTPQSIQLLSSLQKSNSRPSVNQNQGNKSLQPLSPKGILNAQKNTLKSSGNSARGNQMLAFAAQQQLQLANLKLQKQAQMQQCYQKNQKGPVSPSSLATKHRRRSNAADSNK